MQYGGIEIFSVKDYVGFNRAAAKRAYGDPFGRQNIIHGKESSAGKTIISQGASVKFEDVFASGFLMKSVDILRDDALYNAFFLQFGKFEMAGVGLCRREKHFAFVKGVKFFGIAVKEPSAYYFFGRKGIILRKNPPVRAEIGDTACRGNPCSAEKYGVTGGRQCLFEGIFIAHLYTFT